MTRNWIVSVYFRLQNNSIDDPRGEYLAVWQLSGALFPPSAHNAYYPIQFHSSKLHSLGSLIRLHT